MIVIMNDDNGNPLVIISEHQPDRVIYHMTVSVDIKNNRVNPIWKPFRVQVHSKRKLSLGDIITRFQLPVTIC